MTTPQPIQTQSYTKAILAELQRTLQLLSENSAEQLAERVLSAPQVFVAGAGRSGLMMRAFAMRLMHMGIQAYVVGETVTPGIAAGDLLIIGSGSGETKSLAAMAAKAKSLGATLAAATTNPDSTIGQLSDVLLHLSAAAKEAADKESATIQPMGTLFEQSLLLALDSIILRLMDRQGLDGSAMFGRHANLE